MATKALWFAATRPKTLIASISPVLIGTFYALSKGYFDIAIFISSLITGISIQIGTNLANDYFDGKKNADGKNRIGPTRLTGSGLVKDKEMQFAFSLAFFIATLACSYLVYRGGLIILFLLVLAIMLGIGYTAGPISLAYLGLGDLFVIAFFGCVATSMTAYLQTGIFEAKTLILGLCPGFASTSILTITSLRDVPQDRKVHKKTLPVRLGEFFGKCQYASMLIGASIIPTILHISFLPLFMLIPAIPLIRGVFTIKYPEEYIPFLPRTALFHVFYTFTLSYSFFV